MARPDLSAKTAAGIVAHIRSNALAVGQHLPAQMLADALRVSRAPVNKALRQLEAEGVVRLEPNRGFFVAKPSEALALSPDDAGDGAEEEDSLYATLVNDCLSGRLGDRISENELMRQYDVSRTRLLTTLTRIRLEGWATRRPGSGWEFLPRIMSRESYEESYRFRAAIEAQALLLPSFQVDADAFERARAEQVAILDGGFERLSRARIFEMNVAFHEMLVGCARNEFFTDALARVNRLRRLMEYRITIDRSRLPLQSREHLLILDIVEAGDRTRAADFLKVHILGAGAIKVPAVGPQGS